MTELCLARTLAAGGRSEEAGEAFERAVALVTKGSRNAAAGREFGLPLRGCHLRYALFLAETCDMDEAERQFREDLEPGDATSRDQMAWRLAAHPDAAVHNACAALAVKLAKEAADLAPADFNFVNTLGTALFRAGRLNDAIRTLEKAEQLSGGKQLGFQAFSMAMAQWQLGQKQEARQWYDRGVAWIEKNPQSDPALLGFRAEAAELLGAKPKTESTTTATPQ